MHTADKLTRSLHGTLTIHKKYKRVATWIDITSIHQNEKSMQTTSHKPKIKNFNCTTRSKNSKVDTKIVLQSSSPFQLLDYDEDGRPNDETAKTPSRSVEASEGFSLERENMRMVQLQGHLCNSESISSPAGGSRGTEEVPRGTPAVMDVTRKDSTKT